MQALSEEPAFGSEELIASYDWQKFENKLLVDVGGSHGLQSQAIAQHVPTIRCVVQDLPDTIAHGRTLLPENLAPRVELSEHDFFKPQLVHGADAYLLRFILHDWSDENAQLIIQALIPALKAESRILIQEQVLPEWNELSKYQERSSR